MVFSSLVFLFVFLILVLALYYGLPKRFQNFVLAAVSLVFYAWGEPKYILLMIFTVTLCYFFGLLIDGSKKRKSRLRFTWLGSLMTLGILGYFKYSGFIASCFGADFSAPALPIGISFYTFQCISYLIDVYKKETEAQRDWISFCAYVSMFPQLIAGPIVRYKTIAAELEEREETIDLFADGVKRFVAGLAKKVLIANQVGLLFTEIKSLLVEGTLTMAGAWIGVLAFSLQIYYDFSGYSDMAIGLGKMLGFHFEENFNYPYIAASVTDFWRRWHISLSSWFKEYVYIPLGGSRKGKARTFLNLFAVWALTGLWHGASWNYVIWGMYYFVFLCIEKLVISHPKHGAHENTDYFFQRIYTLLVVGIGWMIFAFEDLNLLFPYLKALVNTGAVISNESQYLIKNYSLILVFGIIGATPLVSSIFEDFKTEIPKVYSLLSWILIILGLLLSIIFLVDGSYNPFLYFRF